MKLTSSNFRKGYYFDIADVIKRYPGAIIIAAIGGRNTGKTYSSLVYALQNDIRFVFVKRTIEDVKILCAGNGKISNKARQYAADLSPFVAINRDFGTNIKAFDIIPGLGGFYPCDSDGVPNDDPAGYIVALSAVAKVKGFDLSMCDVIIFDEFIPEVWERINRREGDQLMQLYKTVSRDREHRGKPPLKLILLANAEMISNPVFNTLELTDIVTDMQLKGQHEYYDDPRGICIVRVQTSKEFIEKESRSKIYAAMDGTQWAQMALNNNFGYDDFTAVKHIDMRRYGLFCTFRHKHKLYYIYNNGERWYITSKRNGKCATTDNYDLSRQTECERFYYNVVIMIRSASIDGNVLFEKYSLYDIIMFYKKHYRIGES